MAERQIPQRAIYAIVCTDGRFYVGGTVDVKSRWKAHISALREGHHKNAGLQSAFNALGEDGLVLFVMEVVSPEDDIIEREQFWLDSLKASSRGMNHCPLAGTTAGVRLSDEFRVRMRIKLQGSGAPWAKLSEAEVLQMRSRHAGGESLKSLARSYNVSHSTANRTVHRKTWKHI